MTTTPTTPEALSKAADDLQERVDLRLRDHLGIRPTVFVTEIANCKGSHPARPACPPWCYISAEGTDWEHELETDAPFEVTHTLSPHPEVALSLYPGIYSAPTEYQSTSYLTTAHLNVGVQQRGAETPRITLNLAQGVRVDGCGTQSAHHEALRLAPDDARDLVKALSWILEKIESPR